MKKSIAPISVVALFLMIGLIGCEKRNGDAIVIGKDCVAAVKQGKSKTSERPITNNSTKCRKQFALVTSRMKLD